MSLSRRLLLRCLLLRTEGGEHLPATGPVVVASNHRSFADSVVLRLAAPRRVTFLAKAEYFRGRGLRGRVVRWFFTAVGSVPVERGRHRAATAALEAGREVLADGGVFGIYPEGTRSLDGRLYRGRTGVAWLALTCAAPVVPVALEGTERLQPVGRRLPRPHRVTVRFGAPLTFTGDAGSARTRRAVTDEVMRAIGELSGQERADRFGTSPDKAA
jgi:1-acyl-sn-glycerol-3-phosphate acyltransferase